MYNRNSRLGAKLLSATLMLFCLMLLAGQDVYAQEYKLGDIPLHPEIYKKHLKVWPMEMAEMLSTAYDARDEGFVTPAKNQGSCGSCWAFASVGAMESHMLKAYQAGPEDLSEQQQVSCNTSMAGCNGGSSTAIRYWEAKGPLYEGCFGYTANHSTPCGESICTQLGYRVIDWHTVGINDFKNSLYTYGPSYWRYDVHQDFYDYWNYGSPGDVYVNQSNDFKGGHAVLLIGWDDSIGAYLCKNSWGTTGGPNGDGTFWIAYSGHVNGLNFGMVNFSLTALTCSSDAECDDGIYCNGTETCVVGACQDGTPPDCPDDGLFCNGSEICDELNQVCGHTGDPCGAGTICDEGSDTCLSESCGDGQCDEGENCNNCPSDCPSGTIGGNDCDDCFKETCDGVCHPNKDGPNCPDCAASYCCGDGVCEGAETIENCEVDCGCTSNSDCDDGEDCTDDTCDTLTKQCVNAWPGCNYYDADGCCGPDCTSINDLDCSVCQPKGSVCSSNFECCSNKCHPKKGVCL